MGQIVAMPLDVILNMRNDYEELFSRDHANFFMYKSGLRYGVSLVRDLEEKSDFDSIGEKVSFLAVQTGLLAVRPKEISEKKIVFEPYNTPDNLDPFYMAGYIAGLTSELLGTSYSAIYKEGLIVLNPIQKNLEELLNKKTVVGSDEGRKELIQVSELRRGESYLIKDNVKEPANTLNVFISEIINNEREGLFITRMFPPTVREFYWEKYNIEVPTIWLTTQKPQSDIVVIDPSRYDFELKRALSDFIKQKEGVAVLHGVDFLISRVSFEQIRKFLQDLIDITSTTKSTLLIPMDPESMDRIQFNQLKLDLREYGVN